ncbi:MAG: hypothetical protein KF819_06400 [Labilithrix sp.]|nr:hypothetical protein [Labilithrix sp.]
MYRKPGTSGVLQGVLSGPYTGGKKLVDAAKLSRAARQRLADALAGRGEPSVIVHERAPLGSRLSLGTWALLLGLFAIATLMAIGFGDPRARWAYQPAELIAAYAIAATLCGFAILSLFRRRALATGDALLPGRYLLPLDAVEVPPLGANGDQIVVVTPLGDARDVRVRPASSSTTKREELVILLDGGAEIAFALRSDREAEAAVRRLEHTQRLLEELTYNGDLERALSNDPLFDLRVDASWGSVAPSGPVTTRAKHETAWLHARLTTAGVAALACALGAGAFAGRNHMSDRALYLRALRAGTPEQLERYLDRGRFYRAEAEALRDRLLAQREELARRSKESRGRHGGDLAAPRAEWELTAEEAAARRGTYDACLASLRARAAPDHPEVTRIMEKLVTRARTTGDRIIPVRVEAAVADPPPGAPPSDHATRMATTVWTLERIFSETCPASLVKIALVPAAPRQPDGGFDVKLKISWSAAPTWTLPPNPPSVERRPFYAMTTEIDVVLTPPRAEAGDRATFHLTMPPPREPSMTTRKRSLFVIGGEPTPEGTFDDRVYAAMSARAFDRLYDELHGLLFRGDPRVPLRAAEEEEGQVPPTL